MYVCVCVCVCVCSNLYRASHSGMCVGILTLSELKKRGGQVRICCAQRPFLFANVPFFLQRRKRQRGCSSGEGTYSQVQYLYFCTSKASTLVLASFNHWRNTCADREAELPTQPHAYADVCRRMLTYADVCWHAQSARPRRLTGARGVR